MRTSRLLARAVTALAVVATAVTAGGTAAQAATDPPVLALVASSNALLNGEYMYLTVSASKNTDPDKYLLVFDTTQNYLVGYCGPQTNYCSVDTTNYDSQPHTYIAYSAPYDWATPPAGFDSVSNPTVVTWLSPAVTLTVAPSQQTVGGQVHLTAVSNDPRTETYLQIWDADTQVRLASCGGDTCDTTTTKATPGTRHFVAALLTWDDPRYETWYWIASANANGTWTDPLPPSSSIASSQCNAGLEVLDTTSEGVRVKVYTRQPSNQETDVCVRVSNGENGVGFGGEFVVTPSTPTVSNIPGPPTRDSNSTACTTTTPNGVPGAHPLSGGGIGGVSYIVDAYSAANAAWVCVGVGTAVQLRVLVPISVPSVGVPPLAAQVNFVPDPGTPDIL